MEDKSLSLWEIPLGKPQKKKDHHGFQFGETKMEFHKCNHHGPEKFGKDLKTGTKVEMEHTTNPARAKKIALDHLREDSDYYKKLKACFGNNH